MTAVDTPERSKLTNEMRLERLVKKTPLVKGDEKIAVFGGGGQIASYLLPELNRLYPGRVIACDISNKNGMTKLDVTNEADVCTFIKDNNVKVIINLAALLSGAATEKPQLAHKINFLTPLTLIEVAQKTGVRRLMGMSSIATEEFDRRRFDTDSATASKHALQADSPADIRVAARGSYGEAKGVWETAACYYTDHSATFGNPIQVFSPRLGGVLTAHHKAFANGTTEEVDGLVIAAAVHAVYKDDPNPKRWQEKLCEILAYQHKGGLDAGHYLVDGKYVPEVDGKARFDMIDGQTLARAVLLIFHKDISPKPGIDTPNAVQAVSEYSISMEETVRILKGLNPDFPVRFADPEKEPHLLDRGKMRRAKIWPHKQDTTATEALIGPFKEYGAERSIKEAYQRVVAALKREKEAEVAVSPAPRAASTGLGT